MKSLASGSILSQVVCWGLDDDGQATPPDAVNGKAGFATAIAAGGGSHNLAIRYLPEPATGLLEVAGLACLLALALLRRRLHEQRRSTRMLGYS